MSPDKLRNVHSGCRSGIYPDLCGRVFKTEDWGRGYVIWVGGSLSRGFGRHRCDWFCIYVLNYGLISFNRLNPACITYFALNLLASSLVLLSLVGAFNLASALIQLFWIVISIAAIALRLRAGHRLI